MIIRYLVILLFIFPSFLLNGQDLIVEYNLYNDEIKYFQNGKEIHKPYVSLSKNIIVRVKEFNHYVTKAKLVSNSSDYSQSSSIGSSDFKAQGNPMQSISNMITGLGLSSSLQESYDDINASRGMLDIEGQDIKKRYEVALKEFNAVEEQINRYSNKIQLLLKSEKSKRLALTDITTLKNNSFIRPSRVKELIEEEIEYAFAKLPDEKITVNDLVSDPMDASRSTIANYKKSIEKYNSLLTEWSIIKTEISNYSNSSNNDYLHHVSENASLVHNEISTHINDFDESSLNALEESIDMDNNITLLAELRQVYEELNSSDFTYSFAPVQAEKDEIELNISFQRKTEFGEYENYKNVKQTIPVSGAWKISGGVGLCFGALQNERYKYSLRDQTIVADELDQFVPIVSSFMHFYKTSPRNINLGGSFGVGLPVLGGSSLQSASFFLGPTIIIGQSNRFLITVGAMGAKAERLTKGFSPGDQFPFFEDALPTNSRYELGYFLGLSFNVF